MLALGRVEYFCIRSLGHSAYGAGWRHMHEDVSPELDGLTQIKDQSSARTYQAFLACKLEFLQPCRSGLAWKIGGREVELRDPLRQKKRWLLDLVRTFESCPARDRA